MLIAMMSGASASARACWSEACAGLPTTKSVGPDTETVSESEGGATGANSQARGIWRARPADPHHTVFGCRTMAAFAIASRSSSVSASQTRTSASAASRIIASSRECAPDRTVETSIVPHESPDSRRISARSERGRTDSPGHKSACSRSSPWTLWRPPTVVRPCTGEAGANKATTFSAGGAWMRRACSAAASSAPTLPRKVESTFLKSRTGRRSPGPGVVEASQIRHKAGDGLGGLFRSHGAGVGIDGQDRGIGYVLIGFAQQHDRAGAAGDSSNRLRR